MPINRISQNLSNSSHSALIIRRIARFISHAFARSPRLKHWLRRKFLSLPPSIRGKQMIHDHFIRLSHAYGPQQFALIGANDGITDDPIYPFVLDFGWKGVAVEPVRAYFEQLRQHYEGKPVRCLNIAVHESAREMDFFYLEDQVNRPLPAYAKGIGSFDKAQVRQLAKEVPDGESYIKSDRIACLTLCEVLSQSGTGSIDVIVIDTEGYDSQVVRMINFNRWTPRAIVFEHKLLNQFDLESTLAELKLNGFEWTADQADVLAYRNI